MGVENLKEDKKIIVVVGVHGNKANKILEQIVANFACAYPKNTTCRKKRLDENEEMYDFVSKDKFKYMIANNMFFDYYKIGDNWWGTTYENLNLALSQSATKNVVVRINDYDMAEKLKNMYNNNLCLLFVEADEDTEWMIGDEYLAKKTRCRKSADCVLDIFQHAGGEEIVIENIENALSVTRSFQGR